MFSKDSRRAGPGRGQFGRIGILSAYGKPAAYCKRQESQDHSVSGIAKQP